MTIKHVSLIFITSFFLQNVFAQENLEQLEKEAQNATTASQNSSVYLTLRDAIEQGLRESIPEQIRKYEFEIQELNYKDAKEEFYYPKLSLNVATDGDHFIENLYRDPSKNASSAKTPDGFVGLELEDYTLFNWGRDYLEYLNAQASYKRQSQYLTEQKRSLRFQIILAYFELAKRKKITLISRTILRHTSFIYRLAREQVSLKKVNTQEFLQTKAEFLEAHRNYQSSLSAYAQAQEAFSNSIGSANQNLYSPAEQLKFATLIIDESRAQKIITQRNPELLEAKTQLANANRSYQKTIKDNLPLPKFTLKLGSYKRLFSQDGTRDEYETFNDSANVEIAASLNMKWTIFGSGGFFNSRKTERSFYNKKIAELRLRDSKRQIEVANQTIFSRLRYLEKEYTATKALLDNSQKVFDKTLDNYISRKTSFVNIKYVINNLYNTSVEYENLKFEHVFEKVSLALLMGVDDFPGEKFETLVVK